MNALHFYCNDAVNPAAASRSTPPAKRRLNFSTVNSTVGQNFAAKVRNSLPRGAKTGLLKIPSVRNVVQRRENLRNSLGLNYESPALAESCYFFENLSGLKA
jgi:hypothetical protein